MCLIACPATSTVARSAGWSAGRVSTCTVETELKGNPLVLFGRTKPANERHTRTHTQRGIDRDEVWSRRHPARTVAIGRMNPVLHLAGMLLSAYLVRPGEFITRLAWTLATEGPPRSAVYRYINLCQEAAEGQVYVELSARAGLPHALRGR
jgi:hypothetical protein